MMELQSKCEVESHTPLAENLSRSKIRLCNIDKVYKTKKTTFTAIQDVNINIEDNDFVCIIGPSGCGKSTLLHMIAGLDFPTQGEILINDQRITCPGADRGMVFQTYTLFPWMTVEENIKFGLRLKKMSDDQMNEIADKYLQSIQLTKFRHSYPKELSGGMKQRVAIARALANQPEVLLMDEPFGALDQHTKSNMQLLLREIWQNERPTIVFVTHDIDEAVFLASKIFVMSTHPGMLKKVVNVDMGQNRSLDIKDTMEFINFRKYINQLLYAEHTEDENN
jgi:ABC-type nitrate/sulfonate/bicarbonate transport system, ATPase component